MKKLLFVFLTAIGLFWLSNVKAYTTYKVGDEVSYNGVAFYVIESSDSNNKVVKLLKAEPLTVAEVNTYGVGHINRNTSQSVGTANDQNGYGSVAYYSSRDCSENVYTGCTTLYNDSDIKFIVDAWAYEKIGEFLSKARLITYEDLTQNLGYKASDEMTIYRSSNNEDTPSWVYNDNYGYWTMSKVDDSTASIWFVNDQGNLIGLSHFVYYNEVDCAVRPVVEIYKTALGDKNEDIVISNENSVDQKDSVSNNVNVPNTLKKLSMISGLIGLILIVISLIFVFLKKEN